MEPKIHRSSTLHKLIHTIVKKFFTRKKVFKKGVEMLMHHPQLKEIRKSRFPQLHRNYFLALGLGVVFLITMLEIYYGVYDTEVSRRRLPGRNKKYMHLQDIRNDPAFVGDWNCLLGKPCLVYDSDSGRRTRCTLQKITVEQNGLDD